MRLSAHLTPQWRHRLFIAYAVAMILVFLTPSPDIGIEFRYIDKAVHCGLFFGFAIMFHLDRRPSPWGTFLISAILAGAVELVQWVLPFREVELADFLAGAAGAALGSVAGLFACGTRTE
jgi:VanZ family protein